MVVNTITRWDTEPYHARHYITNELRKRNTVLFIERPTHAGEIMKLILQGNLKELFIKRFRRIDDTFFVYRPYALFPPIFVNKVCLLTNAINQKLRALQINRILTKLNMRDDIILWNFDYAAAELPHSIANKLSLHYCCDEENWKNQPLLAQAEKKTVENVDLVFCVSYLLTQKLLNYNRNTHLSFLGVDTSHITSRKDFLVNKAKTEMAEIAHPIIGYSGVISDRLDFKILENLVKDNKNWNFVFIGFVGNINNFKKKFKYFIDAYDNVHYLGNKNPTEFMYYIEHFDVALVPFRKDLVVNRVLTANNKIFQYLLCGCPFIVTTAEGLIELPEHFYYTAERTEEYGRAIAAALENDSPALRKERTEYGLNSSWGRRIEDISNKIEEYLQGDTL